MLEEKNVCDLLIYFHAEWKLDSFDAIIFVLEVLINGSK